MQPTKKKSMQFFFRSNQLGMDKKKKKSDQTLQKQNAILAIWISYL